MTSYIAILLSTGFDWVHFFKKRLQAVDQCRPCRASSYGEWRCCCNGQLMHLPKTSSHNPKKSQCWIDISSSYIPEFNSYEFCFRFMKAYLRQQAEQFWINFKELATFADNYASHVANHRHCGSVIKKLISKLVISFIYFFVKNIAFMIAVNGTRLLDHKDFK